MNGGCLLGLGSMLMVGVGILSFYLTSEDYLLWGFACGLASFGCCFMAWKGFERRSEYEQTHPVNIKMTVGTPAAGMIWVWFLVTAAAVLYPALKWFGWVD